MTSHPGIVVAALTWNLFHGRDNPPKGSPAHTEQALPAPRVRRGARRAALGGGAAPGGPSAVAGAAGTGLPGNGALGLTSRNELPWLRAAIADRLPDLIKSREGGSNRPGARTGADRGGRAPHVWRCGPSAALCCSPVWSRRRAAPGRGQHAPVGAGDRPGRGRGAARRRAGDGVRRKRAAVLGGDLNLRPLSTQEPSGRRSAARPGRAHRAEGHRPSAGARPEVVEEAAGGGSARPRGVEALRPRSRRWRVWHEIVR